MTEKKEGKKEGSKGKKGWREGRRQASRQEGRKGLRIIVSKKPKKRHIECRF